MPDLDDGQRVTVQGSGVNQYVLARERAIYSCTCPAWRNMRQPVVQRRCKHLIAYLGNTALAPVPAPAARVAMPRPVRTYRGVVVSTYQEPREVRSVREALLADTVDAHVVLADKMEELYNLRLPREIAYVAGFYLALSDDEKAILAEGVTRGLIGIGAWFTPDGHESRADERLRNRADDDPPELVPVMSGVEPDDRYALLYDEPSELPAGVVRRQGARTTVCSATLLETLRERVSIASPQPLEEHLAHSAILAWLDEVLRRANAEVDEESALSFQSLGWGRESFTNPYVPGWSVPQDLVGTREHGERHEAYAVSAPVVAEWIARAELELSEGAPGRALFLGRELHMAGVLAFRAKVTELLIRAYAMLGRTALLETVRVQHRARHPEIELYELPPAHGIVLAASSADAGALADAWEENPPTESDVEEALKRAGNAEVFDAIFERIDAQARDRATRVALGKHLAELLRLPAAAKERPLLAVLIGRIVTRTAIDARAFQRILDARDDELAAQAAQSVDLGSTSQGATPLHIAVRAAKPSVVRVLLDRGADARAKNGKGRMAFDDASLGSAVASRDAHAIMLMLEAAGGGVGKVPSLAASAESTWRIGDKVTHVKFGEGVVQRVESGTEPKLEVCFGKADVKILLGKFLTRL